MGWIPNMNQQIHTASIGEYCTSFVKVPEMFGELVGSWGWTLLVKHAKNVILGVTSQHPWCRSKIYPINDSSHTVDVRNPAPRTMRQMLVLPHYQNLLGHPKWCRIFFNQPYHTARVRESAWFLSTKVKAITSIEKVRALGVGCRGLWKWTAGTRKMEVGGRWCSFSSGWFFVSSCYFSGVAMSELFFSSKAGSLTNFSYDWLLQLWTPMNFP